MRIAINGWFSDQLTTGSGQYLQALAGWMPRAGAGHQFILVKPANPRTGRQGRCRRIDEHLHPPAGAVSTNQRISEHLRAGSAASSWQIEEVRTPFDRINDDLAKLWFEQVAFPRACRRLGAGVAFVPYWGSPWWRPCPVAVTVHDLIPLLLPPYRGGILQRAYTGLVSRTARRAAIVLTDSKASRRDIVERLGIPPARVHAIHLAADPRYRRVADPDELARVRVRYGLPAEPFLLYLGGFDVRKNVIGTVAAFGRLVQRLEDAQEAGMPEVRHLPRPHLVVAGRLPEADSAFAPDPRPVAAQLGIDDRVHFAGPVDEADKPALYSLAMATVFVSEYEGFGLPVLEAMACEGIG